MHYTTVLVGFVEGHEHKGMNDAIALGLDELAEEVKGPVELVNVIPVPAGQQICLIIMAKACVPVLRSSTGIFDVPGVLKWGPELIGHTQVEPQL